MLGRHGQGMKLPFGAFPSLPCRPCCLFLVWFPVDDKAMLSTPNRPGACLSLAMLYLLTTACGPLLPTQNGGHCQPLLYLSEPQVARFELETFRYLAELVAEHDVPCDWEVVGGIHGLASEETLDLAAQHVRYLQEKYPDVGAHVSVVTDVDELARLRVPNAVGAVVQPKAAKLWPYKLVAWMLRDVLARNGDGGEDVVFNLQTNTPVIDLQRAGDAWILHTRRGQIAARDVLLATNAYTSCLLPRLTGLVVPVRGQVCALQPPSSADDLRHSYVWMSDDDSDDYLIQRPDGGPLILGGERRAAPGGEVGVSRDDKTSAAVGQRLRRAMDGAVRLRRPPGPDDPPCLRASYEWTGIMGYSADCCPWVGAVPEALGGGPGLWLAAGYTGHGMPVAAQCALRVVEMMRGAPADTLALPPQFLVTEARAEEARLKARPAELTELNVTERLRMLVGGHDG